MRIWPSFAGKKMQSKTNNPLLWLVSGALLFPLFFQLSGGIYNSPGAVTDSGGVLATLPLPISIGACFVGILMYWKNFHKAYIGIVFVSALLVGMGASIVLADPGGSIERRKLLIALQYLLPILGLMLGLMVRDTANIIPRAFMWILLFLVPVQLVAGWVQKTLTLTHNLYIFSIYQHFQFVPVVFVAAFGLVIVHLWEQHRTKLQILIAVMGVYVIASASFLAIGLYAAFVLVFCFRNMSRIKTGRYVNLLLFSVGVAAALVVVGLYYGMAQKNSSIIGDNGQYLGKFQTLAEGKMPINVEHRLADWKLYGKWIGESGRTVLLGHAEPPPREVKTSAHNWYLDFVYNFGVVALLPLLLLIVYTAHLVWNSRAIISGETWWLAALAAFMVLVDSNFKVTLRQPYPGIFAYFLWGLLLCRLQVLSLTKSGD